ncbi:MAG TPA: nucleotidyltransferase family protein [Steroidobacteraceae bacterium]|nr:nucleotidyltransferase family protein [Steroidobacteraceae bacterium]
MRAMVLAAGRGERMRPLSDRTPKPLLPAGGKPLIGHMLERLARAGIDDIVINLSWLGAQIRAALGDGAAFGVRIAYSEEGPVPLETGGGVVHALPLLGGDPFLVVSGDIWTDFDFARLATLDAAADARIVLVPNPPFHPRGDFGLDGERVIERADETLTYANIGLYRRTLFADCSPGRFPLVDVLRRAIVAGRLRGEIHRGEWMNLGTPEQLATLDATLRRMRER